MIGCQWRLKHECTTVNELSPRPPARRARSSSTAVAQKGLLSYAVAHVVRVLQEPRTELAYPDVQFHLMAASMDLDSARPHPEPGARERSRA